MGQLKVEINPMKFGDFDFQTEAGVSEFVRWLQKNTVEFMRKDQHVSQMFLLLCRKDINSGDDLNKPGFYMIGFQPPEDLDRDSFKILRNSILSDMAGRSEAIAFIVVSQGWSSPPNDENLLPSESPDNKRTVIISLNHEHPEWNQLHTADILDNELGPYEQTDTTAGPFMEVIKPRVLH